MSLNSIQIYFCVSETSCPFFFFWMILLPSQTINQSITDIKQAYL